MKAYLITQAEVDALLAAIDRDPSWGAQGGSSGVLSEEQRRAHDEAHRFYNYQVRTWLSKVTT